MATKKRAAAAKAAPKIKSAKQAAALARRGETEAALAALRSFADGDGDAAAAAGVAAILAYRGEWAEAARYAAMLLAKPSAVYALNVFVECAGIVRRAARELGRPALIAEAAAGVPKTHADNRDAVLLADYWETLERDRVPRRAELTAALAYAPTIKRLQGKPEALVRHCFALACVHHVDDEIVARWDAAGPSCTFEQAVDVARCWARRGKLDKAWEVVTERTYYPVDNAQVAPVVLVIDPLIHPMMTAKRCAQILATPCGDGAAKKR